jgi:hypothetical protein
VHPAVEQRVEGGNRLSFAQEDAALGEEALLPEVGDRGQVFGREPGEHGNPLEGEDALHGRRAR